MLKNEYKQTLVLRVAYEKKFGAAKNRPVPISDGVWICKEHRNIISHSFRSILAIKCRALNANSIKFP